MMSLVLDLGKEEFTCTIYYYWVKVYTRIHYIDREL